jgi:hypothetical protein
MQMWDFQDVFGDIVDPVIDFDFSTGRAKSGLAREGDKMLIFSARADISSIAAFRITAEHKTKDGFIDVGTLVDGNFVFHS